LRRQVQRQRQAPAVGHQMHLGPDAPAGAPQRVVNRLAGWIFPLSPPSAGGMFVGPDDRAVDAPEGPSDPVLLGQAGLQPAEELFPEASRGPAAQPTVDGLPGPVALGEIAPGDPGVEDEQNAVEDPAMILIGAAMPERGGSSGSKRAHSSSVSS